MGHSPLVEDLQIRNVAAGCDDSAALNAVREIAIERDGHRPRDQRSSRGVNGLNDAVTGWREGGAKVVNRDAQPVLFTSAPVSQKPVDGFVLGDGRGGAVRRWDPRVDVRLAQQRSHAKKRQPGAYDQ